MSGHRQISRAESPASGSSTSLAQAKARLLTWADESDARKLKARSSPDVIIAKSSLAVLAGIIIARVLTPRRVSTRTIPRAARVGQRVILWGIAVRVGRWLLPYAIRSVLRKVNQSATTNQPSG